MWQVSEPVFANDTNGWCFTEIGPGQEVFCSRGRVKLDDDDASPTTALAQADSDGAIGKRIRWFMGNATTMSTSSFLAKHSDIVRGRHIPLLLRDVCQRRWSHLPEEEGPVHGRAGLRL